MLALSLLSLASLALASPLAKYTKALEGRGKFPDAGVLNLFPHIC